MARIGLFKQIYLLTSNAQLVFKESFYHHWCINSCMVAAATVDSQGQCSHVAIKEQCSCKGLSEWPILHKLAVWTGRRAGGWMNQN